MFKEIKGTNLKEKKQDMKTISYHIENEEPNENTIVEKYTNLKGGKSLEGINSTFELA